MVEHITRNPEDLPILEKEVRSPPLERRGLCLICGSWLAAGGDQDAYAVTLTRGEAEAWEYVAHAGCLAGVVHASAKLPGAPPPPVPDNQLAAKFRTPSGR